jgi:diguanylate cyclase (GGDEF)-like protein
MLKKFNHLRFFVFLSIVFILPFITSISLAYLYYTAHNTENITILTIILLCILVITLALSIISIFKLLFDVERIISGIKTLIPPYLVNSENQEQSYNKSDFFNVGKDALLMIKQIQNYIRILNLERNNFKDTKTEIELYAIYDTLCKNVFNRSHTESLLKNKVARFNKKDLLAIAIIDIDYFKKVNDTYGHDAGDQILISITKLLWSGLRDGDILGRWGGEEFCIFFEIQNLETARMIFERLRTAVEENEFNYTSKAGETILIPCTVSIGFTILDKENSDISKAVKRADNALYQSKKNGRNKVTYANEEII